MHSPPANSSPDGQHHRVIAQLVGRSESPIGDVSGELWESLSQRLVVLIGQEGFKALFDRSLHLASASHPWLASPHATTAEHSRLEALKFALQARDCDEATPAAVLLLYTFTELLFTLIGRDLTMNILRTAWGDAFEKAVQEFSK